nr:MAG TPA: hypothetical protein [Caudoviricetes sp.]
MLRLFVSRARVLNIYIFLYFFIIIRKKRFYADKWYR